jgi:hypothetical protein
MRPKQEGLTHNDRTLMLFGYHELKIGLRQQAPTFGAQDLLT